MTLAMGSTKAAAVEDSAEPPPMRTSYSALAQHRACPQKWNYSRVMRLEALQDIAVERDLGSWWHALRAAESLTRGRALGTLKQEPDDIRTVDGGPVLTATATPTSVLSASATWWLSLPTDVREEWVARVGGNLPDRLEYMFARWQERWGAENEQEAPLAVEFQWSRTLRQGGAGRAAITLRGAVDEVYLDRAKNLVVVRDHKTHKALASQTAADDMMDSQLQLYAWGATPQVREWGHGQPRATAYDRTRMTAPKEPVLTKAGALSKAVTDYDLHTYLAWCDNSGIGQAYPGLKKDGSGAGLYAEEQAVIERLSTPAAESVWLQRTLVPLNRNLIRTHLRAALDTSEGIQASTVRVERDGEAARNLTKNCRWCEYAKLCRAQMMGGPDGEYPLADYGLTERAPRA